MVDHPSPFRGVPGPPRTLNPSPSSRMFRQCGNLLSKSAKSPVDGVRCSTRDRPRLNAAIDSAFPWPVGSARNRPSMLGSANSRFETPSAKKSNRPEPSRSNPGIGRPELGRVSAQNAFHSNHLFNRSFKSPREASCCSSSGIP